MCGVGLVDSSRGGVGNLKMQFKCTIYSARLCWDEGSAVRTLKCSCHRVGFVSISHSQTIIVTTTLCYYHCYNRVTIIVVVIRL